MTLSDITVTSNCQTTGLTLGLRQIFPDLKIHEVPALGLDGREIFDEFVAKYMPETKYWVTMKTFGLEERYPEYAFRDDFKIIKIPPIHFEAFHPDLVYAHNKDSGVWTRVNYNSAIAIWSYKNGIDIGDAAKLYNAKVYHDLGYTSMWRRSVADLRSIFYASDVDFNEFFLRIKRSGIFMHSFNHPKIEAIIWLAKMVSRKIGAPDTVLDADIYLPDGLRNGRWPVYPEIAQNFGEIGALEWHIEGRKFSGVEAYLEFAFREYREQFERPDQIEILFRSEQPYETILRSHIKGAA